MKSHNTLLAALAATALTAVPAAAHQHTSQHDSTLAEQRATAEADARSQGLVSAEVVMRGDITDGLNEFADIKDLVLSSDGSRVEYVLFDGRGASAAITDRVGFVLWDNVDPSDTSIYETELVLGSADDVQGPDELALTRAEANTRMLSRVLGSDLAFADGVVRPITDVVFNRESGAVEEFVVSFDDSGVFAVDERRIPAEFVRISPSDGYSAVQPSNYEWQIWVL